MSIGNNYFTIGEVAEKTGIKQTVLRFWETEFDVLKPKKNKFGHRAYTENNIETIIKIKTLLYDQGLTIKGAKKAFQENEITPSNLNSSEIKKKLLEVLDILNKNR